MARIIKQTKKPNPGQNISENSAENPTEQYLRVRIKALEIPPVKDGLVIGKSAPIGVEAMLRTLKLMSAERFVRISVPNDDVISDIIVREAVVRKLKEERLRSFILRRVKPLMAENELLMLDMEIEVVLEDTL
jgi:hypothetical protein